MPQIKIYQEDHIPSPLSRIWSAFTDNPFAFAGLWAVCCLLLLALFGPLIAPYSPEHQDPLALLLAPSWEPTGTVEHFLDRKSVV